MLAHFRTPALGRGKSDQHAAWHRSPVLTNGHRDDALVWTTRTGVEFLFQAPKRQDLSEVHVMLVGFDNGSLHLSIYDSFAIGTFSSEEMVSSASSLSTPNLLIHHTSHPDVSTHTLFLRNVADPASISIVTMDLPFLQPSPLNLVLLASKMTMLQKLVRYISQTQLHMQLEYKNARELPAKFVSAAKEELALPQTKYYGPRTFREAIFHLVMTGHLYPPLRTWLADSIGDRVGLATLFDNCMTTDSGDIGPQTLGQSRQISSGEPSWARQRKLDSCAQSHCRGREPAARACSVPLLVWWRREWSLGLEVALYFRNHWRTPSGWSHDTPSRHGGNRPVQRLFSMVAYAG